MPDKTFAVKRKKYGIPLWGFVKGLDDEPDPFDDNDACSEWVEKADPQIRKKSKKY
jgi:hypothetical protein